MSTTRDPMTNTTHHLTACQQRIASPLQKARQVLASAAQYPERQALDMDLCLATRSLYFAFYSWVILNEKIDDAAEADVKGVLNQAIEVMGENVYRDSVCKRIQEFESKCQSVRDGRPVTEPTSYSSKSVA
ncbi:MAG: hypothetical protein U0930_03155 [Pirellulales bacterium]